MNKEVDEDNFNILNGDNNPSAFNTINKENNNPRGNIIPSSLAFNRLYTDFTSLIRKYKNLVFDLYRFIYRRLKEFYNRVDNTIKFSSKNYISFSEILFIYLLCRKVIALIMAVRDFKDER